MSDEIRPRLLIVDDSRMVRASIIKHLKGHYDIREEADGEAAWQTLVLDHSIQAVISDLSMPVMDGFGLLSRIREAKTQRIRQLPVVMISGEEDEESRDRAKALGANDFITKGIGTAELLARVDSLVRLGQAEQALDTQRERQMRDERTGLFSRAYLDSQVDQALSLAKRQQVPVSVLILGFDALEQYSVQYGGALVDKLQQRFAQLLAGNIRKEDSLGHFNDTAFAIVCPGSPGAASLAFANRLKNAVAAANIAVHGQRLPLTVSIGVACVPVDGALETEGLLVLADERRLAASGAGGNQVIGPAPAATAAVPEAGGRRSLPLSIDEALALLAAGKEAELRPNAAALARTLMPLLSFLNYELQYDVSSVASQGHAQPAGEDSSTANPGGDAD